MGEADKAPGSRSGVQVAGRICDRASGGDRGRVRSTVAAFCQAVLKTIGETRQLLGEMERTLLLDGPLPAELRDDISSYDRKILAYSGDQIIPVRRPVIRTTSLSHGG